MKSMVNALSSYGATALLFLLLALPGSAFAIAGRFEFVNGQVQIIDASGARHTVNKGDVINQGDTISASANGFAQIKMEDGGFFAVRPDTQFRIDTFNFDGKEDGSEKGAFSLLKGSLRSVTGLIGKIHRDNYKISTATSVIGIRGSGADVGHSDDVGTAVHTLFGGHTLTSHGQTIETGPGQTALAAPGQPPKFVPNFPFNTSTSPGDKSGNGSTGNSNTAKNTQTDPSSDNSPDKVVIPIRSDDGVVDLTKNTDNGSPIGSTSSQYIHFAAGILNTGSGFQIVEEGSNKATYSFSNYSFSSNGGLTGVDSSNLSIYNADEFSGTPSEILSDTSSSFEVTGGTESDLYHTPDNSLYIGRSTNTVVDISCGVCSGSDTFVNSVFIVGLATPPAFVQTITGSTTYSLVASTHPTDGFGNVGTLNSAFLNANFTTQTVNLGANLSINNKTLTASASSLPIVADGFEATSASGLSVSCSGSGCGGGYAGDIGGKFFGNGAATAGFEYLFFPSSNTSGNFTDVIQGVAAFSSSSAPTAIASDPAPVGSGGSVVGLSSTYASLFGSSNSFGTGSPLFGGSNVVDNQKFAARLDANGDLMAFAVNNTNGGSLSGGTTSAVITDGSDTSLGVVWGRWNSGYVVNVKGNNTTTTLAPSGKLAFITGTQATTTAQLAAMPGLGVISASYTLAPGNFPTVFDGVSGSHITSASASVNFSVGAITSFMVSGSGTGGQGFGTWTATSAGGPISNFMGSTGIPLSGSCNGGAGGCSSSGTISGIATGGFVGAQAQGLASTIGLNGPGGTNIGAAVYMKR